MYQEGVKRKIVQSEKGGERVLYTGGGEGSCTQAKGGGGGVIYRE